MNARIRFQWTLRRSLAATAIALGALAMLGNPVRGHVVTIDTQELATIVAGKVDHVTPAELAEWIVRGASDYRLIDIRDAAEYAQYHIPGAENVPIAQLPDWGLPRNEKIVLYSEGGTHSAQAWMLLRAQGYRGAYILFGGLEAWRDEIVFPVAPAKADRAAAATFERATHLARYFGGHPRAASADSGAAALTAAAPERPTLGLAVPAAPRVGGPVGPRKKKEGC